MDGWIDGYRYIDIDIYIYRYIHLQIYKIYTFIDVHILHIFLFINIYLYINYTPWLIQEYRYPVSIFVILRLFLSFYFDKKTSKQNNHYKKENSCTGI